MNYIKVGPDWGHNPREVLEDPIDGLTQIINSRAYLLKFCLYWIDLDKNVMTSYIFMGTILF